MEDIRSILRVKGGGSFLDPNVLAFWSFGDDGATPSVDLVTGRPLALHDMEVKADADGIISLARKNENAYAESPGGEQEFPTGDFTVEARFRAGPITRKVARSTLPLSVRCRRCSATASGGAIC